MTLARRSCGVAALVALSIGTATLDSMADSPADACLSTPVQAQTAQRAGKLVEARRLYESCARNVCPPEIVTDCSRWFSEVEAATPSVVLAARDPQHGDVLDARVSIDGAEAAPVTARAVALDPGAHHLVFQRSGAPDVAVDVVLREGEKNRAVSATFAGPPASPTTPPPADDSSPRRPVPVVAWIAGGVGVLGMASFATFGALGVSERAGAHCDTGCGATDKSSVDSKYLIANVSLGVGLAGLGVATWLYLARPSTEPAKTAVVDVHPTPGGAFATFGARF